VLSLGEYSIFRIGGFLYSTQSASSFFHQLLGKGIWSWHLLCVWDKSHSHPHILSSGYSNHKAKLYIGPHTELTCSTAVLAWVSAFSSVANWLLISSSLSATEIVDSPIPQATATRQPDMSPLRRGYPQPPGWCEIPGWAFTLWEISLRHWGVRRETTQLRSQ
jgi:hypothetical protein